MLDSSWWATSRYSLLGFFLTIKHREVTVNADEDKDLWIPKEIVFSMGNSEIKHTETEASVV